MTIEPLNDSPDDCDCPRTYMQRDGSIVHAFWCKSQPQRERLRAPDPEWVAHCYQVWKRCPYDPEFRDLCEALDELCEAVGVTDAE